MVFRVFEFAVRMPYQTHTGDAAREAAEHERRRQGRARRVLQAQEAGT